MPPAEGLAEGLRALGELALIAAHRGDRAVRPGRRES
jgi:hypothetical protein